MLCPSIDDVLSTPLVLGMYLLVVWPLKVQLTIIAEDPTVHRVVELRIVRCDLVYYLGISQLASLTFSHVVMRSI